jgi:hypothetical protein
MFSLMTEPTALRKLSVITRYIHTKQEGCMPRRTDIKKIMLRVYRLARLSKKRVLKLSWSTVTPQQS